VLFLSHAACKEGCDLLFVPGGSYVGNYHPMVVTMNQNLLPFVKTELQRFGWGYIYAQISVASVNT